MKKRYKISNVCKCLLLVLGLHYKGEGASEDITVGEVQSLLGKITTAQNQIQQENLRYSPDVTKVIVLGEIGSGKSSLVHALAGKTMQGRKKNGKYIVEVNLDNQIPGIQITDSMDTKNQQPASYIDHANTFVYWELPGFMNPDGYKDIETLFAAEQLFTSPCKVKVLLTLDRDSFDATRGKTVIGNLNKLFHFFQHLEEMKQAVSIVVTKQLWDDDDANPINPMSMFQQMGFVGLERVRAADIGIEQGELERVSSILTYLGENGRIFSFPRPKQRGDHNYAGDPTLFSDRVKILADLRNPASDPQIDISSNFVRNDRARLIMIKVANHIKDAEDQLYNLFHYMRKSIFMTRSSITAAQAVMDAFIADSEINTPAILTRRIRYRLNGFLPSLNEDNRRSCEGFLDILSASESYMKLFSNLNKVSSTNRVQVQQLDMSNTIFQFKKFSELLKQDLEKAISQEEALAITVYARYGNPKYDSRKEPLFTAELFDFRYPERDNILSRFIRNEDVRIREIDQAMFDTIDVDSPGLTTAINWSKTINEEFSWGLTQSLGVGVAVKASAGLFGFGVETQVSTQFTFGANQNWRHSQSKTLSRSGSFTPPMPGVYKLGMFTVGMEGFNTPFSAKIAFSKNDPSVSLNDIMIAVREKCPGVTNLRLAQGIITGEISGTLTAKSALDTIWVERKVV